MVPRGWTGDTDSVTFPVWFQRIENAALAVVAFVELGFAWWWLLVMFLV